MLDKIKKIKYARMKPEERYIYDIFTNIVEYYDPSISYKKYYKYNNVLLFDYNLKNGYFWCHYDEFWSVIEDKFHMNYQQIKSLIKSMVEEHLICKDIAHQEYFEGWYLKVEEHLICKDITPSTINGEFLNKFNIYLIRK